MAAQHHGSGGDNSELMKRYLELSMGISKRTFSHGRLGADDDGDFVYAIAADTARQVVLIKFPKPTEWIGLKPDDVQALIDNLQSKLFELRGITV